MSRLYFQDFCLNQSYASEILQDSIKLLLFCAHRVMFYYRIETSITKLLKRGKTDTILNDINFCDLRK